MKYRKLQVFAVTIWLELGRKRKKHIYIFLVVVRLSSQKLLSAQRGVNMEVFVPGPSESWSRLILQISKGFYQQKLRLVHVLVLLVCSCDARAFLWQSFRCTNDVAWKSGYFLGIPVSKQPAVWAQLVSILPSSLLSGSDSKNLKMNSKCLQCICHLMCVFNMSVPWRFNTIHVPLHPYYIMQFG